MRGGLNVADNGCNMLDEFPHGQPTPAVQRRPEPETLLLKVIS